MTKRCEEVVPLLGPLRDLALAEDDRAWVDEHLAGCASCRDRLALLEAQGAALREAVRARAAQVSFEGFADKVLLRARKEKPRALEGAGVWTREMLGAHRSAFAGAAGLMVAACMALAVVFVPQQADEPTIDTSLQSQVEEVDFGTHDGAVLQLAHDTTVIWMSDDRESAK